MIIQEAKPVEKVLPESVQKVVDKVIDKLVRIVISDKREYIGKLMSVDKTKSVFLMDSLEVIDRSPEAE